MSSVQDPVTTAIATVNATTLCLSTEEKQGSDLFVTATGTAATVTATLPAAGAGLFHYITSIDVHSVNNTAADIAGTALVAVTSTNLPGSMAWTTGNAMLKGAKVQDVLDVPAKPIKSSVANTATTVVCAAKLAGTFQRVSVHYFTAK